MLIRHLPDELSTQRLAEKLAEVVGTSSCIIFLRGDLGAGKTTFCRYFIRASGYAGTVKSPTYTIVETYHMPHTIIFHFDLYRIHEAEELAYLGIEDYLAQGGIFLIEWPERGGDYLPQCDINFELSIENDKRKIGMTAYTPRGEAIIKAL